MCRNCPYWYEGADFRPSCHVDKDAGKFGPSKCDAEFAQSQKIQKGGK